MLDNILNLEDWVVYGVRESPEGYQFTCAYPAITLCPRGHAEDQIQRFGRKEQLFLDLPMHGKRVALLVHRYRCKVCGKTFWQPVPDMDDRRWMAARLVQYIQTQALRRTFVSIASEMTNWHAEIFGYFAVPGAAVTNAITEALNGVAKVTNRLGRGYSFAVVRAKMLYAKRSGLLSTSYRRTIAAMPYNLPLEQQDTEVKVEEIAFLVEMMQRLDHL